MKMTMGVLAAAATLTLAGPAGAVPEVKPLPTPASESPDSGVVPMHCSGHPHTNRDSLQGRFFDVDDARIRRFPHTSCTADGQGDRSQTVDYHCYAVGDQVTRNGRTYSTWTYLRNVTTGVQGWVSDALLDLNPPGNAAGIRGSLEPC